MYGDDEEKSDGASDDADGRSEVSYIVMEMVLVEFGQR